MPPTRPHTAHRIPAAALAALLLLPGCVVLEERLVQKEKEADALREAIAQTNRKNAECESKGDAFSRELSEARRSTEELGARVRAQEEELGRLKGRLAETKKDYEGTTISREELIRELLEKEKGTGKRIQELALEGAEAREKADALRKELEAARAEAEARSAEVEALRKELAGKPSEESLRQERDLLLGRVERLSEDRSATSSRRGRKLYGLAERVRSVVPGGRGVVTGSLLRLSLPPPPKGAGGAGETPAEWIAAAGETAEAFREEDGCLLLVSAAGKDAEAIRKAVVEGKGYPEGWVVVVPPPPDGGAEILLKAP